MRPPSRPMFAIYRTHLALLAALLVAPADAQPADPVPAQSPSKKDTQPAKKPELPKPPAPKPASEITLKVGDKAPAFKPDTWVKPIPAPGVPGAITPTPATSTPATPGAPSPAAPSTPASSPASPPSPAPDGLTLDPSRVYIVEFWATWCQSCREAMPLLAKLARDNKDLVLLAVASSERKPGKDAPDQRLDGVRRYVDARPESFPCAVIFDGSRTIANSWIAAAGRVYLPTCFIIDTTGTITWIGDPRDAAFGAAVARALKSLPQPKPGAPGVPEPRKKNLKPRPKG